ncbi:hypothetical protein E4T39_01679 [Aureobasidium subglaciale]|nr:hypothetical protein E4T39_01679 [Aureobasidium subglaciale]
MPIRSSELLLKSVSEWRTWLTKHGQIQREVWLVCVKAKAPSNIKKLTTITYFEALDEALCFGWVDSRCGKRDEHTMYWRFTPRRPKSTWSARNVGYVERLTAIDKMAPAGLLTVEAAKANGLWDAAYSANAPEDLSEAVSIAGRQSQKAWEEMTKKDKYALFVSLGSSPKGSEARKRKIEGIVEKLTPDTTTANRSLTPKATPTKALSRTKAPT